MGIASRRGFISSIECVKTAERNSNEIALPGRGWGSLIMADAMILWVCLCAFAYLCFLSVSMTSDGSKSWSSANSVLPSASLAGPSPVSRSSASPAFAFAPTMQEPCPLLQDLNCATVTSHVISKMHFWGFDAYVCISICFASCYHLNGFQSSKRKLGWLKKGLCQCDVIEAP